MKKINTAILVIFLMFFQLEAYSDNFASEPKEENSQILLEEKDFKSPKAPEEIKFDVVDASNGRVDILIPSNGNEFSLDIQNYNGFECGLESMSATRVDNSLYLKIVVSWLPGADLSSCNVKIKELSSKKEAALTLFMNYHK